MLSLPTTIATAVFAAGLTSRTSPRRNRRKAGAPPTRQLPSPTRKRGLRNHGRRRAAEQQSAYGSPMRGIAVGLDGDSESLDFGRSASRTAGPRACGDRRRARGTEPVLRRRPHPAEAQSFLPMTNHGSEEPSDRRCRPPSDNQRFSDGRDCDFCTYSSGISGGVASCSVSCASRTRPRPEDDSVGPAGGGTGDSLHGRRCSSCHCTPPAWRRNFQGRKMQRRMATRARTHGVRELDYAKHHYPEPALRHPARQRHQLPVPYPDGRAPAGRTAGGRSPSRPSSAHAVCDLAARDLQTLAWTKPAPDVSSEGCG